MAKFLGVVNGHSKSYLHWVTANVPGKVNSYEENVMANLDKLMGLYEMLLICKYVLYVITIDLCLSSIKNPFLTDNSYNF